MTSSRIDHLNTLTTGVSEPALRVEGVGKTYRRRKWFGASAAPAERPALSDVSFTVERGETVGILGPNGAGKTTLVKIITTLLYPSTGSVFLNGENVFASARTERARMGLVTCDERSFYWRLSGRQNLRFFAAVYRLPRRAADARIGRLLETLGLEEAADRAYQEYSSGMRQKLAIARGLLGDPALVLYDEPTRSLDPLSALNVRDYIRRHRAEVPSQTHLIATNQMNEAEYLCDRVLIVNKGRLIAFGTIAEVKRMWQQGDYTAHAIWWSGRPDIGELHAMPDAGLLSLDPIVTEDPALRAVRVRTRSGSDGLSYALGQILRSGGTIVRCETEDAAFDEVFCSLVRDAHAGAGSTAGDRDVPSPREVAS